MIRMKSLRQPYLSIYILTNLILALVIGACYSIAGKKIIGQTADIRVTEAGFNFKARIDTGAKNCSINAIDIEAISLEAPIEDIIGEDIRFTVVNGDNEARRIESTIKDVATIRNSQGVERRYVVELELIWKNRARKVFVNLRDRDMMTFKLLIGRNWLADEFLVDVDRDVP